MELNSNFALLKVLLLFRIGSNFTHVKDIYLKLNKLVGYCSNHSRFTKKTSEKCNKKLIFMNTIYCKFCVYFWQGFCNSFF